MESRPVQVVLEQLAEFNQSLPINELRHTCHNLPRAIPIDKRAGNQSDCQCRNEGDDVGVGDFGLTEPQVAFDGVRNERWKCEPGQKGNEESN